jgi:DNA polymerase III delta subunit
MKVRTFPEAERLIATSHGGCAFAVAGPELCQARWLMERMVSVFGKLDYDILRFDASDLAEGDIRRHLLENSFLSSGKLLVISEVHSLGKRPAAELVEALETGFKDSAMFLASTRTPRELVLLKKLENLTPMFLCYEPYERDMTGWVSRMAAEEEITLDAGVTALLIEHSGRSLHMLTGAIQKLSLYHGRGARVDVAGMKDVLSGRNCPDVFHLGDMVFGRNRGEAVRTAWAMISNGDEPLAMLSYLFGLWQKVVTATEVVGSGGGQDAVATATGTSFPVLGKLMGFAKVAGRLRIHPADSAAAFEAADRGLKSGEDSLAVFGRLIFTLTSGGS